jgi:hypothetical protein
MSQTKKKPLVTATSDNGAANDPIDDDNAH